MDRHSVAVAGNRYFFGDCGPMLKPNNASSSRRFSRYVPQSCSSVQPAGRSADDSTSP
ncbi:MAG TPA: hypothetical protein VFB06_00395 [Streptosporangiaceae bacterium]|nr:hypothetical protein [Streptosporangiaceae bacterium]